MQNHYFLAISTLFAILTLTACSSPALVNRFPEDVPAGYAEFYIEDSGLGFPANVYSEFNGRMCPNSEFSSGKKNGLIIVSLPGKRNFIIKVGTAEQEIQLDIIEKYKTRVKVSIFPKHLRPLLVKDTSPIFNSGELNIGSINDFDMTVDQESTMPFERDKIPWIHRINTFSHKEDSYYGCR
jgi:hypothetical protein